MNPDIQKAHALAVIAQKRAHAPYSHFPVGAVFKFKGEAELIAGCNVENASYPAGLCAERTALFSSVPRWGRKEIEWGVIIAKTERPTFPCGLCLQTMNEFSGGDFPLYLGNEKQILQETSFHQLLPLSFNTLPGQN